MKTKIEEQVKTMRMTMISSLIDPLGKAETGERIYSLVSKGKVPNPIECNFCKNIMKHEIVGEGLFKIWKAPDRCNCEETVNYWERYNNGMEKIEKECEEFRDRAIREIQVERLIATSDLGRRFRNRTFETFEVNKENEGSYEKAYKFANGFVENEKEGRGLLYTGTAGTGKTHLVAAISNYLMYEEVIPVKFGNVTTLLSEIKSTYDKNSVESEAEVIEMLSNVRLLIIDDLGKEKASEWSNSIIYTIINNRYENYKPLIVTTNLTMKELERTVGDATVSRLIEMCDGIKMDGSDYRKTRLI